MKVTTAFWLSYAGLWVLMIFQSLVLLGVLRTVYGTLRNDARMPASDEDLRGQRVPTFATVDLHGRRIDSAGFVGQPSALLFLSPNCRSCSVTLDELEALQLKTNGNVIVFCRATDEACARLAHTYQLRLPVVVDEDLKISQLFRVSAIPTAVPIDAEGVIQPYRYPMRSEEVRELLVMQGEPEEVTG